MSSVGTYLRDLRQRKGVSLEEIARTTRVAQRYLESIEADAFEALPSRVFTRGFLRAYCQALGESPDEVLAAYDGREIPAPSMGSARTATVAAQPSTAVARARPGAQHAADVEARGRGAVLVSFVLLVVLGVALFAVALVIHPRERSDRAAVQTRPESSTVRESAERSPAPVAAAPAVSALLTPPSAGPVASTPHASAPSAPSPAPAVSAPAAPSASPGASPSKPATSSAAAPPAPRPNAPAPPAPTAPAASATPPAPSASVAAPALDNTIGSVVSPYRLVARTNDTTWIRVRTEDGRMSEETVPPGEVREWVSNRPFVLTVGNAGGVSLELNGRALPPLGPKGFVIQRIVLPPEAR